MSNHLRKGNTLNGGGIEINDCQTLKLTQRTVSDTETRGPDWQCPRLSPRQSSSGFSPPLFWSPAASEKQINVSGLSVFHPTMRRVLLFSGYDVN